MNTAEDKVKNIETTKESKWHQCPRCSFWFDCLTEPSFANRPEEVPPQTADLEVIDIKKEVGFTVDTDVWANVTEQEDIIDKIDEKPAPTNESEEQETHLKDEAADEQQDSQVENNPPELKMQGKKGNRKVARKRTRRKMKVPSVKNVGAVELKMLGNKGKYLFNGREVHRDDLDQFSKLKKCVACCQFVVKAGLHILNEHSEDSEVIFHLTEREAKKDMTPREGIFPRSKKELKEKKDKRAPQLCPVCNKWVYQLNRHLSTHERHGKKFKNKQVTSDHESEFSIYDELDKPSTNMSEKYMCNGQEVPKSEVHNYSPYKQCSQCLNFVVNVYKHAVQMHSGINSATYTLFIKEETGPGNEATDAKQAVKIEGEKLPEKVARALAKGARPPKQCPICKKWCTNVSEHLKQHVENRPKVYCDKCGKGFVSKDWLENHNCPTEKEVTEKVVARQVPCPVCKKIYATEPTLKEHMKRMHSSNRKDIFPCPYCSKLFRGRRSLRNHEEQHKNEPAVCPVCSIICKGKFTLRGHMTRCHSNKPEKPKVECHICKKMYSSKSALRSHMAHIHSGKTYNCNLCSKTFKCNESLTSHMVHMHGSGQAYQCDKCVKVYPSKSSLRVHIHWAHSDKYPAQCDLCPAKFKAGRQLKIHKAMKHSTDRPWLCPRCGMKFGHRWALHNHIKNVHEYHEPVPCEYPDCTAKFKYKDTMQRHIKRVHTQPVCDECNILFSTHQEFHVHMNQHAGKQVFTCNSCAKVFPHNYLLVNHMKSHNQTAV